MTLSRLAGSDETQKSGRKNREDGRCVTSRLGLVLIPSLVTGRSPRRLLRGAGGQGMLGLFLIFCQRMGFPNFSPLKVKKGTKKKEEWQESRKQPLVLVAQRAPAFSPREVKFRAAQQKEMMHRLDPDLRKLDAMLEAKNALWWSKPFWDPILEV